MLIFTKRITFVFCGLIMLLLCLGISIKAQDDENDPVKLFNQGQDAHEKGDFKKALEFYNEALRANPDFPEAEYQKGIALQSLNLLPEAIASFKKALELRENWTLPMTSLGEAMIQLGKFEEAEPLFQQLIGLEPQNFRAYESLADIYLRSNSSEAGRKKLLSNLKVITSNANAPASTWAARGAMERSLGDLQAAKISIARALELNPNDVFSRFQAVETFLQEKNYEEALKLSRKLAAEMSVVAPAQVLHARVLAESGNSKEALAVLDRILGPSKDAEALRSLILSSTAEDAATLEAKLNPDPKNPAILGKLCILTRTSPAKALEYCRRASEAEPSNIGHAVGYGAALVQAKRFESAIGLFRKILTFEPENPVAHANLATALFEMKRYAEAKAEYSWLISKNPNLSIANYFLAICHDNLGEYTQALENYQRFVKTADPKVNQLEIDKVNLRLPILQRQIKQGAGSKKGSRQKK